MDALSRLCGGAVKILRLVCCLSHGYNREMAMNPDRWTHKTQQAFQDAQALAQSRSHQEVAPEHLLAALLAQAGGIVPETLKKAGVEPKTVSVELDKALARKP